MWLQEQAWQEGTVTAVVICNNHHRCYWAMARVLLHFTVSELIYSLFTSLITGTCGKSGAAITACTLFSSQLKKILLQSKPGDIFGQVA